ncbi:hypothetical protein SY88_02250 [Clostridiales bacterium PH28_bin88]|nr:hypothetical protein SY88_02250 [Clostridiales bacterium PH28_bin88]
MSTKIYCDESRITQYKYRVLGGIWIKADQGWNFVNDFHHICREAVGVLPAHMKWGNVPTKPTSKYMPFYTELIDLYFSYNQRGHMFFCAIVVDPAYDIDHKIINHGDPEEGFYKLYFQLIFRKLDWKEKYHIRLAYRDVAKKINPVQEFARLTDLKNALNHWVIRESGYTLPTGPVASIQSRPAKERRLIQLADILMGAVGYHWHEMQMKPEASEGKTFLANYIASKLGRKSLAFTTYPSDRLFNIFYFRPRGK